MLELNAPGEIWEEDTSLQPIKLFRSLLGGKDMAAGRIKEKLVTQYSYQWKTLENTQDRL